jgi:hypothetical protein
MADTSVLIHDSLLTSGARAYGGPAHGRWWALPSAAAPPDKVVLGDEASLDDEGTATAYVLVHHPRSHRPARDHLGNYLYMPVRYGFAPKLP